MPVHSAQYQQQGFQPIEIIGKSVYQSNGNQHKYHSYGEINWRAFEMAGLIKGRKLMKRWGMTPYEFLHRFVKQGLIAYDESGQEVSPNEALMGVDDQREDTEKMIAWHGFDLPGSDEQAQQMLDKVGDLYFDEGNAQGVADAFHLPDGEKFEKPLKAKKKHHTEKPRLRARTVAAELWAGKYKDYSVPELINTQEMLDATKKSNGKYYSDRTVKDWIKDLCPNPPLKGAPRKKKSD